MFDKRLFTISGVCKNLVDLHYYQDVIFGSKFTVWGWGSNPFAARGADPTGGTGYVAILPTCGPPMILPPSVKRWGPPRRQVLCCCPAHLWATSDSAPRSETVGTPQAAGVM